MLPSILKSFLTQIWSYHNKERIWKGVSNFWVIQNNQPVIDRISKINTKKKAATIRTFDFSTLYTKIPHNLLKAALIEIIEFVFKGGISNGVYVSKYGSVCRKPSGDDHHANMVYHFNPHGTSGQRTQKMWKLPLIRPFTTPTAKHVGASVWLGPLTNPHR